MACGLFCLLRLRFLQLWRIRILLWLSIVRNADPYRVTANVYGDFEYVADPDDPAQHMLYVNHVANGPSSVVVAQADGVTGQIVAGTLTSIAKNFNGQQKINGPEFVHPPGSGLGVLYRDTDGVHGVFRPLAPKAWNDFSLTIAGQPAGSAPPKLPSTYSASYETGGLALGQNTYVLLDGPCTQRCFANMRDGIPTDAAKFFAAQKLTVPSIESLVQGVKDGTIDTELCTNGKAANQTCGIYEATIDDVGGFAANSVHLLTTLPPRIGPAVGRIPLAVGRHPGTGTTVFLIAGAHEVGETADIYEQVTDGGPLTLVKSVPAEHSDHYRLLDDGKSTMILHYLERHGNLAGSYIIPITASGGHLEAGNATRITASSNGAEVEYLPAAGKFAIFYRTSSRPSLITRCFFTP